MQKTWRRQWWRPPNIMQMDGKLVISSSGVRAVPGPIMYVPAAMLMCRQKWNAVRLSLMPIFMHDIGIAQHDV